MEYYSIFKNYMKEVAKFESYKQLSKVQIILLMIGLSPLILVYLLLMLMCFFALVFFKCLSQPRDYLLSYVHKERDAEGVKHATQCVIYLIGFGPVVLLNLLLAFISCSVFVLFFALNFLGYIVTLGGTSLQPFLHEYSTKVDENHYKVKRSNKHITALIVVSLVYFLISILIFVYAMEIALYNAHVIGRFGLVFVPLVGEGYVYLDITCTLLGLAVAILSIISFKKEDVALIKTSEIVNE